MNRIAPAPTPAPAAAAQRPARRCVRHAVLGTALVTAPLLAHAHSAGLAVLLSAGYALPPFVLAAALAVGLTWGQRLLVGGVAALSAIVGLVAVQSWSVGRMGDAPLAFWQLIAGSYAISALVSVAVWLALRRRQQRRSPPRRDRA